MPLVLGALPEIVAALVALVTIYALVQLFSPLLRSIGNHIPFFGGALGSALDAILQDTVNAGLIWARSAVSSAIGFILAPVYWFEHLVAGILDDIHALASIARYIVTTVIQQAVNIAVAEASVLVARAEQALQSEISSVVRLFNAEISQVYATIQVVDQTLTAFIEAEIARTDAFIVAEINAETAYVQAVATALEGEISTAIQAETAFVESEFKAAIAYTTAAVAATDAQISIDLGAITSWVAGEIGSLDAAITAVSVALSSYVVALVGAVATDLTILKEDCTDNLCSGLSEAANLANGLASQAWMAALLGYAAWAAVDPEGCGHDTADVLGPIASGAADAVTAAFSAL